jgi:hypothetical protein
MPRMNEPTRYQSLHFSLPGENRMCFISLPFETTADDLLLVRKQLELIELQVELNAAEARALAAAIEQKG